MAPAREPEPEREPLARPKPQPPAASASAVNSISSVASSAMDASPEREEALSVISSDASPGASVFDLLSAADAAGLALFTPSPQPRRAARSLSIASVNSSPGAAGSRLSSAASSPSQFFRSPVRSRKPRTPASASGRPPTTPSPSARMRVQRARRPRSEATTPVLPLEIRIKEEVVETATPTISSFLSPPRRTGMTPKRPLSTMFRTPSPPSKQPGSSLSRRLKDEFDETELLDPGSTRRNSLDSAPDDLFGGSPTGLSGLGDHDSFFSFANSLSPLVHTELESSFLSVKMSPMSSFSSNDLQRLLPPFPANRLNDENDSTKANATSAKPPTETDGATSLLIASFPNIRASTTATPGKSERSKLEGHSTIKMRLHSPFEPVSSFSTRDLQAINNSLKRKNHGRKRKLEEKKTSTSNVQRKLLQTPVKSSASPMRSPLRPLNGRVAQTSLLSTVGENEEEEELESSHKVAQQNAQRNLLPTSPKKRKAAEAQENLQPEEKLFVTPARKFQKISVSSRISRGAVCTTTPSVHLAIKQEPSDPAVANAPVSTSSNVFQTPAKMFHTPIKLASSAVGVIAPPFIGSTVSKKAPCNCKKSKCLKLYCECFASGGYCDESCNCVGCSNTPAMETERQEAINARLEKNPNAFKPKIEATAVVSNSAAALNAARIMMAGSGTSQLGSDPSAFSTPLGTQRYLFGNSSGVKKMHKHGCHCKKSACQKKYCECYQAGVPCGDNCRCIDCKNQAPCVTHPSPAVSTTSAITPSRDIDETFVSPVLQGVRKRLRIDRETWAKNFSSPFESSPSSLRERTERFRSRLQAVTSGSTPLKTLVAVSSNSSAASGGAGPLSVRLKPVDSSSTPPPSTPKRVSFAAIRGAVSPLGETASKAPPDALTTSSKAREMRPNNQVDIGYTKRLDRRGRVIVLPLFGDNLPPLKIDVSAQIFRFLTNADLHNASLVNRLWSQVALGDSVWDHANFIPAGATDSDHQVDEHHALVVRPSTAK